MGLERHFSDRAKRMEPLAIRDILKRGNRPGVIPFIAGQPVPALFPTKEIGYQANEIFNSFGPEALQYGASQGYEPLRQWVADRYGTHSPDNVLIISGSQQALDLSAKLFVMPDDKVIVAAPTYSGALSTYVQYGAQFVPIPCDNEGMLPGPLEAAMADDPRLVYCVPNFMNPTGVNMSLARRQQLATLAKQYDVPILEDDPYGELRFEGERLPNLVELAPEHVLYASTFSKIMAPGLRLAWVLAGDWVIEKLITAKQTSDMQSASYTQRFLVEVLEDDFIDRQIVKLRAYYRGQRDTMVAALRREFPAEVTFESPAGGMFVWCQLPDYLDATQLLEKALDQDVAYMPGAAFFHDGSGQNFMRLSFTLANEADTNRGIATLGNIIKEAIASHGTKE